MVSLRKTLLPAAAAAAGVAGAMAYAAPAQAEARNNPCRDWVCMYYSKGKASADYARDYSYVYPDFSDNCYLKSHGEASVCYVDTFADNGNGAGALVRNDAHGAADDSSLWDIICYYPGFGLPYYSIAPFTSAVSMGNLTNEDASYFDSY
jgi:hypothetical protein